MKLNQQELFLIKLGLSDSLRNRKETMDYFKNRNLEEMVECLRNEGMEFDVDKEVCNVKDTMRRAERDIAELQALLDRIEKEINK